MCRTGNPADALGVVATADAPDGASPPGDTGEARNDATIAENDTNDSFGNISRGMPAFLEDYLHARFSGCGMLFRWAGGVEELLILEVESLQRSIFEECCFGLQCSRAWGGAE